MRLEVGDREFCYECESRVAMTVDIGDLGDQKAAHNCALTVYVPPWHC
jgi:hypothetical protein